MPDAIAYEPLPLEFHREGRTLRQLQRNARAAIYGLYGLRDALYGYEVVEIRTAEAREFRGSVLPAREVYPPSSVWGTYGFSYGAAHRPWAEERFRRITRGETGAIVDPPRPKRPKNRARPPG